MTLLDAGMLAGFVVSLVTTAVVARRFGSLRNGVVFGVLSGGAVAAVLWLALLKAWFNHAP